jgi:MFS family permease
LHNGRGDCMKFIPKFRQLYNEYPRNFWVVITTLFIDQLGGALVFPFMALFITAKFGVGMTEVGQLLAIVAVASVFGSMAGGAMTDKFGRKAMIIFGLVVSALSALFLGFAEDLNMIYIAGLVVGLFGNVGGPAQQAMIADLLPEEKRADGFGLFRVVANLAVTIGPAIGGILATHSYLWLFVIDAIASTTTALIVSLIIPETKPEAPADKDNDSMLQTLRGYFRVIHDGLFVAFILTSIFMVLAYVQMNSTLSVYLRDFHGVSSQGFGYILSLNAGMVVLFQFWITRRIKHLPPMIVMALGTLLCAVGFSMYGFVSTYTLFMLAMAIITVGEMFFAPVGQALVARLAPEDMRGRYLAMYGFSWTIPVALGPWIAGLIMDNYNPNWVWYACGLVSVIAIAGYLTLHARASSRFTKVNTPSAPK